MSRPTRLLLLLLAGLLLLGAVGAFLWSLPPIPADAQGVGIFGTSATGTRTNCTQITNPVVGQTFCFDQSANALKVWNGSVWLQTATATLVNVKDYGAKGDGTTDDTVAVQAAINAFGTGTTNPGGTIFFPLGDYRITSTLTLPINVQLVGVNTATDVTKASAILYTSASAATCALAYPGTINAEAYVKLQIRDLQIALTATNTYGICLRGVADVAIDRVYIEGVLGGTNRGIYCEDCIFTRITRSHFNRMQYAIVSDEIFNANTIFGNQFLEMDRYAILLRGNVGGFNCCQGVWVTNNHFIKLAGASTYLGALHVVAPAQSVVFENNTLEVMQDTAVLTDRTDPIAGGGSGFVDGLSVRNNLFVAGVATNVVIDYTRYSTLGPNANFNPAGPAPQFYFVGNNASNNVIPPGTQTANKPLISDTGIVDTLVSDSGASAFYTGIQRSATDPQTNAWGVSHAGRVWWNSAVSPVRFKYWDGTATRNLVNALESTGAVTISGAFTQNSDGAVSEFDGPTSFTRTTANNGELRVRHGSLGTYFTLQATNQTNATFGFSVGGAVLTLTSAGGAQLGAPTLGDRGAGTINIASSVLINGVPMALSGTPTCPNNCGLSPSVAGNNTFMRVTMGATGTPATPFLVLFSGARNAIPSCVAQIDTPGTTAATVTRANASATGVQINTGTGATAINPPTGAVYSIHCEDVG